MFKKRAQIRCLANLKVRIYIAIITKHHVQELSQHPYSIGNKLSLSLQKDAQPQCFYSIGLWMTMELQGCPAPWSGN